MSNFKEFMETWDGNYNSLPEEFKETEEYKLLFSEFPEKNHNRTQIPRHIHNANCRIYRGVPGHRYSRTNCPEFAKSFTKWGGGTQWTNLIIGQKLSETDQTFEFSRSIIMQTELERWFNSDNLNSGLNDKIEQILINFQVTFDKNETLEQKIDRVLNVSKEVGGINFAQYNK
jgi:hypothetical protein